MKFLDGEVRVLLPFLSSIERVNLFYFNQLLGSISAPKRNKATQSANEITVNTVINDEINIETFYQMGFEVMFLRDLGSA